MKRGVSEHDYARDRNEKSYTEYQNQATMKETETGIKGFSEDLPKEKLYLNDGKGTTAIILYKL